MKNSLYTCRCLDCAPEHRRSIQSQLEANTHDDGKRPRVGRARYAPTPARANNVSPEESELLRSWFGLKTTSPLINNNAIDNLTLGRASWRLPSWLYVEPPLPIYAEQAPSKAKDLPPRINTPPDEHTATTHEGVSQKPSPSLWSNKGALQRSFTQQPRRATRYSTFPPRTPSESVERVSGRRTDTDAAGLESATPVEYQVPRSRYSYSQPGAPPTRKATKAVHSHSGPPNSPFQEEDATPILSFGSTTRRLYASPRFSAASVESTSGHPISPGTSRRIHPSWRFSGASFGSGSLPPPLPFPIRSSHHTPNGSIDSTTTSSSPTSPAKTPVFDNDYLTGSPLFLVLLSLFLATLLVALDITIISVAIPSISSTFSSLSDVGWYGSAYLMTTTALQPAAGKAYNLLPLKPVYLISLLVFELGSIICAASQLSSVFIVGRAIAGVGAAGLIQGALGTVTRVVELEKRPLCIGVIVSGFGISACIAPVLGGILTDTIGWRWCFWINLPVGGIAFVLVAWLLKSKAVAKMEKRQSMRWWEKVWQIDPLGILLLLGAVCCLLLVLQWGGSRYAWSGPKIVGLLVAFAVLIVAFGTSQWWMGDQATIPPRVLFQRSVLFGSVFSFFFLISSNIKLYEVPIYFQAVRSASAIRSGVLFLPLALPQVVATVLGGALATKTGHYIPLMIGGSVICTVGSGLMILLDVNTSTLHWATYGVIAGFGDGLAVNMPYTAFQVILGNEHDVFIGNGIATFFSLAGGAIGIGAGSNLFVDTLLKELPKQGVVIESKKVLDSGLLGLTDLTLSPMMVEGLKKASVMGFQRTMVLSTVAASVALVACFGMQWRNLRTVSNEQKEGANAREEKA